MPCSSFVERAPRLLRGMLNAATVLVLMLGAAAGAQAQVAAPQEPASAGSALDNTLIDQVRELALHATEQTVGATARSAGAAEATPPPAWRYEVVVGTLDPRLKLAPCQRIEPHMPPGTRLWGKARIGLRCAQGPKPWNVYLPITVKVFGPALVAALPLPAGSVLREGDLVSAEIDLAEATGTPLTLTEAAIGRSLARPLAAGQGVRQTDLKPRQWFAAGDNVKVRAVGPGFSVVGSGQALTAGIEGQTARVRTEGGQVVTGLPVATRQLEVAL